MMTRTALCALAWMSLITAAMADPVPVRVAVISDAENKNLAALVTTELSGRPDMTLVERDDLAKVGDELKLQQLASNDSIALGKLIGADGIIFIDQSTDAVRVRLTAVGLGYALFDDQITFETGLPQLAKSIAHRVAGYAPKLKLDPAKAIPISVLNLRADYATEESTAVERKLTLLLESSLTSLPNYVVLERRHAWSLGFEHALATAPKPLLQGEYIVDGALSLPVQGANDITIHLRLRSPNNQLTPLEIRGAEDDMPTLVEKMTAEIQKAIGSVSTLSSWQPRNEARQYLAEGIWASQHGTCEETIEALDSAELLGETAPDLLAIRIPELCLMADSKLEPDTYGITPRTTTNPNPDQRIEFMTRAIGDFTRYRNDHLEKKLVVIDPVRSGLGRTSSLYTAVGQSASKVLVMLIDTHNPRAGEVRSAIRSFENYHPLDGKMPKDWGTAGYYADDWSVSMDEEIAYFRTIFENFPNPAWSNSLLSDVLLTHKFCARFLPTVEQRNAAALKFYHDLLSDPPAKPLALYYLAETAAPPQKGDFCHAFYQEIWTNREQLLRKNRLGHFLRLAFELEKERNVTEADPEVIALLHYYLQHDTKYSNVTLNVWYPELFPLTEAPSLFQDLQAYEKRAATASGAHTGYFDSLNRSYTDRFGDANAQPTTVPHLVVNRFWYPWLAPDWPQGTFTINLTEPDEEGVWVSGFGSYLKPGLFKINLPDFSTKEIAPPDNCYFQTLKRTPDALYATYHLNKSGQAGDPRIARLDPKTWTWAVRPLPNFFCCNLFSVGRLLYLFLNVQFSSDEVAVARYDWDKDQFTILASSRRVPPHNQFDDTAMFDISGIFAGPENRPCLTCYGWGPQGTFAIDAGVGNWASVFDGGWADQTLTVFDQTLVLNRDGEVTMFDPRKAGPEYLMAPQQPHFRKQAARGKPTVKEQTPWLAQTLWNPPDKEVAIMPNCVGFHSDRLYFLVAPKDKGGDFVLLCYQKGKGRLPRRIPLQFHLDDGARAIVSKQTGDSRDLSVSVIEHPNVAGLGLNVVTTNQGLCLKLPNVGFWFLPYSDIDSYLAINSP